MSSVFQITIIPLYYVHVEIVTLQLSQQRGHHFLVSISDRSFHYRDDDATRALEYHVLID